MARERPRDEGDQAPQPQPPTPDIPPDGPKVNVHDVHDKIADIENRLTAVERWISAAKP